MISPYMDTRELAIYLRLVDQDGRPSRHRAHRWLTDNRVPYKRRGVKTVLVRRDDVEAKLEAV